MATSFQPQIINKILAEAGECLLKLSRDPTQRQAQQKSDGSVVTPTDSKLSDFLYDRLSPLAPVVCEERPPHRHWSEPYFLVDPLDGTQYYSQGEAEFAICVAYMVAGKPVYGGIFSPSAAKVYWAEKGSGAYCGQDPLPVLSPPESLDLRLFSSGFHRKKEAEPFLSQLAPKSIEEKGSALKFCDMAEGAVDLYIRFGPTQEWDTAAAQVLLGEVGLDIWDMKSWAPLEYGKADFLNRGLLVGHKSFLPQVASYLQALHPRATKER